MTHLPRLPARKPACPECDTTLTCPSCADPRPIAGQVQPGWSLLTPLGRWEEVVSADQPHPFGPVLIRTKQSGDLAWRYSRTTKVEATPARRRPYGKAEIRVVEGNWRNGPIYAVACLDTDDTGIPTGAGILATGFKNEDATGWSVHVSLGSDGANEKHDDTTKVAAPTLVRGAGRRAARMLGVKLNITPPA
jgi:hypothetical protein